MLETVEDEILEIKNSEIIYSLENESNTQGIVFNYLSEKNLFIQSTNFSKTILMEFFILFSQFFQQIKVRGKKLKYSIIDHFLLILIFYKTGSTLEHLGDIFNIEYPRVRSIINRSRIILNKMFHSKWKEEFPKFNPSLADNFLSIH